MQNRRLDTGGAGGGPRGLDTMWYSTLSTCLVEFIEVFLVAVLQSLPCRTVEGITFIVNLAKLPKSSIFFYQHHPTINQIIKQTIAAEK